MGSCHRRTNPLSEDAKLTDWLNGFCERPLERARGASLATGGVRRMKCLPPAGGHKRGARRGPGLQWEPPLIDARPPVALFSRPAF
jgi:hypothetical protein